MAALPELRAAGFAPTALAPAGGELAALFAQAEVPLRAVDWHDSSGARLGQASARAQLAAILRDESPALLHANSLAMARLAGPVAAELNLPSIGHLRDIVGLSATAIADLNRHTRLLAVSKATRQFHLEQGVAAKKTFVLYNGVDLDRFQPGPRGAIGETRGLCVGCIGQIIQRKGQDLLVPLAQRLRRDFPQAKLWIVGDRPSQKDEAVDYERRVRHELAAASAGQVEFLGRRGDIPGVLRALTVLVHPARQEPLGRVLLEAAATGLAIVTTDSGGTAEIFPPEAGAAIVVPAGDAEQIAEGVLRLLGDPRRRAALARAARLRAETAFDARTSGAALARHYIEVLR